MLRDLAYGGLGVAALAFILYRALAPFRRIWRGDASAADTVLTRYGRLAARNYLAYLLWVVPGVGGLLLLCTAVLLDPFGASPGVIDGVLGVGLRLFTMAWPLALVHVFVHATNRPGFLVPPPFRDQPGAMARNRRRDRAR